MSTHKRRRHTSPSSNPTKKHRRSDNVKDSSDEITSLSAFLEDRELMINEAFLILGEKKVTAMMPQKLTSLSPSWAHVRSICLKELELISTPVLVDILEGRPPKEKPASLPADSTSGETEPPPTNVSKPEKTVVQANDIPKTKESSSSSIKSKSKKKVAKKKELPKKSEEVHVEDGSKSKKVSDWDSDGERRGLPWESDEDGLEIGINPQEMGDILNEMELAQQEKSKDSEPSSKLLQHDTDKKRISTKTSIKTSKLHANSETAGSSVKESERIAKLKKSAHKTTKTDKKKVKKASKELTSDRKVVITDGVANFNIAPENQVPKVVKEPVKLAKPTRTEKILEALDDLKDINLYSVEDIPAQTALQKKTMTELLELQMRAKLLKSLLRNQQENPMESDDNSLEPNIKLEVVSSEDIREGSEQDCLETVESPGSKKSPEPHVSRTCVLLDTKRTTLEKASSSSTKRLKRSWITCNNPENTISENFETDQIIKREKIIPNRNLQQSAAVHKRSNSKNSDKTVSKSSANPISVKGQRSEKVPDVVSQRIPILESPSNSKLSDVSNGESPEIDEARLKDLKSLKIVCTMDSKATVQRLITLNVGKAEGNNEGIASSEAQVGRKVLAPVSKRYELTESNPKKSHTRKQSDSLVHVSKSNELKQINLRNSYTLKISHSSDHVSKHKELQSSPQKSVYSKTSHTSTHSIPKELQSSPRKAVSSTSSNSATHASKSKLYPHKSISKISNANVLKPEKLQESNSALVLKSSELLSSPKNTDKRKSHISYAQALKSAELQSSSEKSVPIKMSHSFKCDSKPSELQQSHPVKPDSKKKSHSSTHSPIPGRFVSNSQNSVLQEIRTVETVISKVHRSESTRSVPKSVQEPSTSKSSKEKHNDITNTGKKLHVKSDTSKSKETKIIDSIKNTVEKMKPTSSKSSEKSSDFGIKDTVEKSHPKMGPSKSVEISNSNRTAVFSPEKKPKQFKIKRGIFQNRSAVPSEECRTPLKCETSVEIRSDIDDVIIHEVPMPMIDLTLDDDIQGEIAKAILIVNDKTSLIEKEDCALKKVKKRSKEGKKKPKKSSKHKDEILKIKEKSHKKKSSSGENKKSKQKKIEDGENPLPINDLDVLCGPEVELISEEESDKEEGEIDDNDDEDEKEPRLSEWQLRSFKDNSSPVRQYKSRLYRFQRSRSKSHPLSCSTCSHGSRSSSRSQARYCRSRSRSGSRYRNSTSDTRERTSSNSKSTKHTHQNVKPRGKIRIVPRSDSSDRSYSVERTSDKTNIVSRSDSKDLHRPRSRPSEKVHKILQPKSPERNTEVKLQSSFSPETSPPRPKYTAMSSWHKATYNNSPISKPVMMRPFSLSKPVYKKIEGQDYFNETGSGDETMPKYDLSRKEENYVQVTEEVNSPTEEPISFDITTKTKKDVTKSVDQVNQEIAVLANTCFEHCNEGKIRVTEECTTNKVTEEQHVEDKGIESSNKIGLIVQSKSSTSRERGNSEESNDKMCSEEGQVMKNLSMIEHPLTHSEKSAAEQTQNEFKSKTVETKDLISSDAKCTVAIDNDTSSVRIGDRMPAIPATEGRDTSPVTTEVTSTVITEGKDIAATEDTSPVVIVDTCTTGGKDTHPVTPEGKNTSPIISKDTFSVVMKGKDISVVTIEGKDTVTTEWKDNYPVTTLDTPTVRIRGKDTTLVTTIVAYKEKDTLPVIMEDKHTSPITTVVDTSPDTNKTKGTSPTSQAEIISLKSEDIPKVKDSAVETVNTSNPVFSSELLTDTNNSKNEEKSLVVVSVNREIVTHPTPVPETSTENSIASNIFSNTQDTSEDLPTVTSKSPKTPDECRESGLASTENETIRKQEKTKVVANRIHDGIAFWKNLCLKEGTDCENSVSSNKSVETTKTQDWETIEGIGQNYENQSEKITETDEEKPPETWYDRWYQSRQVQNVVSTSKMYGKVRQRNKLKAQKEKTKPAVTISTKSTTELPEMIGSLEEYEKIFGKKAPPPQPMPLPAEDEAEEKLAEVKMKAVVADPESDDELWGDILGS